MKEYNPPITNINDAFSVKGLTMVISGGNGGIGYGIAEAFAQGGADVAILCRNIEKGYSAVEKLSEYGTKVKAYQADVKDIKAIQSAADKMFADFDTLDVLVNNAGIADAIRFLEDDDLELFRKVADTDLYGTANMVHTFVPKIIEGDKGGSVINISSIGGQSVSGTRTHPNIAYHAAKAAIDNLTKSLAIEFGDYGIRVNAVAPGPTHSGLDVDLPPDAFVKISEKMPMHRFGEPIEIGALCVYLASPAGCHVSGTIMVHDGGLLCTG